MKAVISGTPLQLEGEPAEIAQVAELMTTGAVMVEHVHKWRIGELTEEPTVKGACWCGQERDFNPHLPANGFSKTVSNVATRDHVEPRIEATNTVAVPRPSTANATGLTARAMAANAAGKRPFCEDCGRKHKVGNHRPTNE